MRRSDLVQNTNGTATGRTSQIIFGERQHLLRVLDSLRAPPCLPAAAIMSAACLRN